MDANQKNRLKSNVTNLPKMASAWFIALAGMLATWWFSLTPDAQLAALKALPFQLPAETYPAALTIVGLVLRIWPQKSLMPPDEPTDVDTQPLDRKAEP